MLTIGEIFDSIEEVRFPHPVNFFLEKCAKRESEIKKFLLYVLGMIKEHVKFESDSRSLSFFEENRLKLNVKNLNDYSKLLVKELDVERIKRHIECLSEFRTQEFKADYLFLIFNSLQGSILSDIIWAQDLSIGDALKISQNDIDKSDLSKYLPKKIIEIKNFQKEEKIEFISDSHLTSIEEIIKCYDYKLFNACIVLLLTTIEGLVRDLAKFLIIHQNIEIVLTSEKYNSLNNLLRKINWLKDIEISNTQLNLINQSKEPDVINYGYPFKFDNKYLLNQTTNICLKERLGFLKRRFKEHRDNILHGNRIEHSNNLIIYANLSALTEVINVIQYYNKLYNVKNNL